MRHYNIAIDGPTGSGKSTLAKNLAARLGWAYLDTGAIYRTVGLYVYRAGADPGDGAIVAAALLPQMGISLRHEAGGQRVFLGEEDVSDEIRIPQVASYASQVAVHPAVRAFLLDTQRAFAREHNVVMDGRDIGTEVLPNADVKVFLTASLDARAQRRYKELHERGVEINFEEVRENIRKRDERDMTRELSPLKAADDAVLLDTTHMDLEESIEALVSLAEERLTAIGDKA